MQKSKGIQELYNEFHENKLSHAFLLETNDIEQCLENLLLFLARINETDDEQENAKLERLITSLSLPSLIVIRPDGLSIKKEQVLDMMQSFQTKPTFSKYNMYVFMNAESLNASSANTILKFLEEPEDNILGFFITNNKENVIDTIRSRCQIILDYYEGVVSYSVPKVWHSIAINYIKEYESVGDEAVLYNRSVLLPLIHDRKELLYLFQSLFKIYASFYQVKIMRSELSQEYEALSFLLKKDTEYFFKQMNYLSELLDELNYNLNIQFLLDRFVLESR